MSCLPLGGKKTAWERPTKCCLTWLWAEAVSRKTVRAENQGQCALTLSPEDGILVTDLSRRTFPMVHLLEWNPTRNMF